MKHEARTVRKIAQGIYDAKERRAVLDFVSQSLKLFAQDETKWSKFAGALKAGSQDPI